MKKIKVLIVDDSPVVRDGLGSILSAHGDIDVVGTAENGLDAVSQSEKLRPHVVLMDAQMPGMDGVEAIDLVKKSFPEIQIIFLAVHTSHIQDALSAGADVYLMKDCGRQELLSTIRALANN